MTGQVRSRRALGPLEPTLHPKDAGANLYGLGHLGYPPPTRQIFFTYRSPYSLPEDQIFGALRTGMAVDAPRWHSAACVSPSSVHRTRTLVGPHGMQPDRRARSESGFHKECDGESAISHLLATPPPKALPPHPTRQWGWRHRSRYPSRHHPFTGKRPGRRAKRSSCLVVTAIDYAEPVPSALAAVDPSPTEAPARLRRLRRPRSWPPRMPRRIAERCCPNPAPHWAPYRRLQPPGSKRRRRRPLPALSGRADVVGR